MEAFQIVGLSCFSRLRFLRAGGRPTISRRRGLCLIWNRSKCSLQLVVAQAVVKSFQHLFPKNLDVENWPHYVWPRKVSTMIQHNTPRILDTINPNPKRAQQDKGRQRLVGQKTSYFQTRGQKSNRAQRAADAMPCQFMRDARKARAYEDRIAKRKRPR